MPFLPPSSMRVMSLRISLEQILYFHSRPVFEGVSLPRGANMRSLRFFLFVITVIILNIGTDRSEQTVQTQIRLLLMEQSDQGLLCLLFSLHLLNAILHCKIQLFQL